MRLNLLPGEQGHKGNSLLSLSFTVSLAFSLSLFFLCSLSLSLCLSHPPSFSLLSLLYLIILSKDVNIHSAISKHLMIRLTAGSLIWLWPVTTPAHWAMSPLTELLFFVLNIGLSVEDHCGYDFPWAIHRLVPFCLYGGAPHHDLHHLKFKSNYAPYFTHWDRLFGTLHED